ncbi:unnamed protein product [Pedinophyceae sp. YPF-701]|nr:unnamed protein product [Pedinophyceae sp. YPF-701]
MSDGESGGESPCVAGNGRESLLQPRKLAGIFSPLNDAHAEPEGPAIDVKRAANGAPCSAAGPKQAGRGARKGKRKAPLGHAGDAPGTERIKVLVRLKPDADGEPAAPAGARACFCAVDDTTLVARAPENVRKTTQAWRDKAERKIKFDRVFGPECSQQDVFDGSGVSDMVRSLVESAYECADSGATPQHMCVAAYGITGSGKTFTMDGLRDEDGAMVHGQRGLLPRALEALFGALEEEHARRGAGAPFRVVVSICEVYNEAVYDLQDSKPFRNVDGRSKRHRALGPRRALEVTIGNGTRAHVAGLRATAVSGARDALQCLAVGARNRETAPTQLNQASSRSHAIFTATIVLPGPASGPGLEMGKLSFVDLAGSERQGDAGNMERDNAERFEEARGINKSLFALENCFRSLRQNQGAAGGARGAGREQGHVPFRESTLTKILCDALQGHGRILMVLNIATTARFFLKTMANLEHGGTIRENYTSRALAPAHGGAEKQPAKKMRLELRAEERAARKAQREAPAVVAMFDEDALHGEAGAGSGAQEEVRALRGRVQELEEALEDAVLECRGLREQLVAKEAEVVLVEQRVREETVRDLDGLMEDMIAQRERAHAGEEVDSAGRRRRTRGRLTKSAAGSDRAEEEEEEEESEEEDGTDDEEMSCGEDEVGGAAPRTKAVDVEVETLKARVEELSRDLRACNDAKSIAQANLRRMEQRAEDAELAAENAQGRARAAEEALAAQREAAVQERANHAAERDALRADLDQAERATVGQEERVQQLLRLCQALQKAGAKAGVKLTVDKEDLLPEGEHVPGHTPHALALAFARSSPAGEQDDSDAEEGPMQDLPAAEAVRLSMDAADEPAALSPQQADAIDMGGPGAAADEQDEEVPGEGGAGAAPEEARAEPCEPAGAPSRWVVQYVGDSSEEDTPERGGAGDLPERPIDGDAFGAADEVALALRARFRAERGDARKMTVRVLRGRLAECGFIAELDGLPARAKKCEVVALYERLVLGEGRSPEQGGAQAAVTQVVGCSREARTPRRNDARPSGTRAALSPINGGAEVRADEAKRSPLARAVPPAAGPENGPTASKRRRLGKRMAREDVRTNAHLQGGRGLTAALEKYASMQSSDTLAIASKRKCVR